MNDPKRRKTIQQIVLFSLSVSALAWIAPSLGGSPTSSGPGFILWAGAPLLVSTILRIATRDWSDLGIRPAIGQNLLWYLISLLALPVLMLLTLLVVVVLSLASFTEFSLGKFLSSFLTALLIFFFFAIFEEVGWRGYLSPKLDSLGLSRIPASALVAAVWAAWHLPFLRELAWVYAPENLWIFIPRFFFVCFFLSILYGEIRSRTAAFWPAVLMHAMGNAFGHPLAEHVKIAAGTQYLASISNGLIFIALTAILGFGIHRWRTRKPVPSTSVL